MMPSRTISVPERGTVGISNEEWNELSRSPEFWQLVEHDIVSVEHHGRGQARLRGGCYVGRGMVSKGIVLELHEKVPGSLAFLLRHATGTDFRVARVAAPASEPGPLIALLVEHFVDAVRRYATRGRRFRYQREQRKGSLVGGRLDVTGTIRLWSRGFRHLAAFDKDVVSFDLPLNRTVLAALREVGTIEKVAPLSRDLVAEVRGVAMLFSDCQGPDVVRRTRLHAVQTADELAAEETDPAVADMLALAAVILSHESFENDSLPGVTVPRAWFLNLETLFERAIRNVMKMAIDRVGTVESGRVGPPAVFPANPGVFRANPDIVLRLNGTNDVFIGDAKYKQWTRTPVAGDVYQLLVHASAFASRSAFLVFPADAFDRRELGDSTTGASVNLYGLNVVNLAEQVVLLLADLGVPVGADAPPDSGASPHGLGEVLAHANG